MSTHALLVRPISENYEAVYVHFDGYPKNMLPLLNTHYTDSAKVTELFSLGDMSYLEDTIEKSKFYCRDMNEDFEDVAPKSGLVLQNLISKYIDYTYLFDIDTNQWNLIYSFGKPIRLVSDSSLKQNMEGNYTINSI